VIELRICRDRELRVFDPEFVRLQRGKTVHFVLAMNLQSSRTPHICPIINVPAPFWAGRHSEGAVSPLGENGSPFGGESR
jgi:hypothetical protein